jgi:hypothetical protein
MWLEMLPLRTIMALSRDSTAINDSRACMKFSGRKYRQSVSSLKIKMGANFNKLCSGMQPSGKDRRGLPNSNEFDAILSEIAKSA